MDEDFAQPPLSGSEDLSAYTSSQNKRNSSSTPSTTAAANPGTNMSASQPTELTASTAISDKGKAPVTQTSPPDAQTPHGSSPGSTAD